MFNNIGEKIKLVAKITTWAGIAISAIFGIILMALGEEITIVLGIVILVIGSLLSWVGSFLFYGFGQLVSKAEVIADDMDIFLEFKLTEEEKRKLKKMNAQKSEASAKKEKATETQYNSDIAKTPKIRYNSTTGNLFGTDAGAYVDVSCPHCGERLSFTQEEIVSGKEIRCAFCNGNIRLSI